MAESLQNSDLKDQLGSLLAEQAIAIRQRRRLVEERWLQSRRTWLGYNLDKRFTSTDTSSASYSIPLARKAAERTIVRGVKLLTPNVKWFEVSPMGSLTTDDKVTNVDQFMWYILRKKIRSRAIISQLVRSMFLCGLCHLKTSVTVRNGQVWPTQRAVDPFALYIWPETSPTAGDAEVIFEDFLFSYERYKTFVAKGIVDDIPRSDLTKPEWPYYLTERMAYQGITDPTANVDLAIQTMGDRLEKTTAGFASLTEMWLTREDRLYQVYILWNHKRGARCVGFITSPYDEPLYRTAVHRMIPGELYSSALMQDIDELNTIHSDLFNKFMDAVDWEQGFAAFNDSTVGRKDTFKMKGRAKWEFSDDPRAAMEFINPPVTSTNVLRAWQIVVGLINANAGTGSLAEGQPGRNMPRAGFAVNNLINLGMSDIQDVAEVIEQEVLTPALSDIYKVSSQFIPDEQLLHIPGGQGLYGNILRRRDIIGDYEFDWVGSLQFQDDNRRAQQLMIFLNMLPTLAPMLQQQGYQFNIADLVKMIWRYGLGERGLTEVVQLTPPGPPIPSQALPSGPPGAPGEPPTPQGPPVPQSPQEPQTPQQGGNARLKYRLPAVTNGFIQQ